LGIHAGTLEQIEAFRASQFFVDENKNRETPLHLASRQGKVEVAHMLIERGADVEAQNKDGETPLHLASQRGQVEVAPILIAHGANLAAQNKDGETPLHLASRQDKCMLIEYSADLKARNMGGNTALHLASQKVETKRGWRPSVLRMKRNEKK
jgi:ankyrin repeat protein